MNCQLQDDPRAGSGGKLPKTQALLNCRARRSVYTLEGKQQILLLLQLVKRSEGEVVHAAGAVQIRAAAKARPAERQGESINYAAKIDLFGIKERAGDGYTASGAAPS